ncbi:hypothetical protein [Dickeya chrysanthemi]|uniref:hypothetical protein n=1 Tax=Dickeya chrysanthemi TaxID=556 RepID=UPI0003A70F8A|nr:hypothetical protein [Dickeya chrysanthemi]MBX9448058.1 hypothetical protein [Dickeya chrysanthemi]
MQAVFPEEIKWLENRISAVQNQTQQRPDVVSKDAPGDENRNNAQVMFGLVNHE